jgi:hypothetical protein
VHAPVDTRTAPGGYDLLDARDFRNIMGVVRSGRVKWLHGGPPCKTFSRARWRDQHGHAHTLRSDRYLAGLPGVESPKLREGNELARRMAKLAKAQRRVGGYWAIENPGRSYTWQFPPVAKLKKLPGVRLVEEDQCVFGGLCRKPTGWLTNVPFRQVLAHTCPGSGVHPPHPTLEGRTIGPDG